MPAPRVSPVLILAFAALLSTRAGAQMLLHETVGKSVHDEFGSSIDRVQDLDGDGVTDLLIGARFDDSSNSAAGRAIVVSGASGDVLREFLGTNPSDLLGSAVAGVGDIDGDGSGDILIGIPGADEGPADSGIAVIYSGATGAEIRKHYWYFEDEGFGARAWSLGDITGDGVGDYAIQNAYTIVFGYEYPGTAECYSGATGAHLSIGLGDTIRMYGVRDTNGDGLGEFVVAHDQYEGYQAELRTGPTGTVLDALPDGLTNQRVGPAGDFDGDGLREYIFAYTTGTPAAQVIEVRSLVHGSVLSLTLPSSVQTGEYFDGRGDVNGDGKLDVIVGFPGSNTAAGTSAGLVRVYSGLDRSLLLQIDGQHALDNFGAGIADLGDVNGDGRDEFAVAEPAPVYAFIDPQPGRVFVYTLGTFPWSAGGPALPGLLGEPYLTGTGSLQAGATTALTLYYKLDHAPVAFVLGISALNAAFKGGVLGPAPDVVVPGFETNAVSALIVAAPWPAGIPSGTKVWFQAWIAGDSGAPQGWSASNTIVGTVPP